MLEGPDPKFTMKKALVVIDMLNDFVQRGAPLEVPGAREAIPVIQARIAQARRESIPIIYVCDNHRQDDPEFQVWPPHAVRGTAGQQVVKPLAVQKGDRIVLKTTYSGFFGTRLEALLKRLKVKELILTGVCTEICVLYTAVDALMRGYRVHVPERCVAGLTPEGHAFALKQMREVLKPKQR